MDIFTRLRVKGVGLSLDDFGTGTSSLTQLYKMPFSEVKIDGVVISEIATTQGRRDDRARDHRPRANLSLTVCAEGIENPTVSSSSIRARCDAMQGDFIASAMPASEIENFIHVWNGADHTLVPVMRK